MTTYLFILSLPYCGSTVLWRLLTTSPHVSALPVEGQYLESVRSIMRAKPWDPEQKIPWDTVKSKWEAEWDLSKPILLEKSPPNLIRANEIQKAFSPSYFMITIRNPYAFCHGYVRRKKTNFEDPARKWVSWAEYQRKNIEGLDRSLFFTYEDFTDYPIDTSNRMVQFLPQLEYLKPDNDFLANSTVGYETHKITNLNEIKIRQLSVRDIVKINSVLERHLDLLHFFGYQMIDPVSWDDLRHFQSTLLLKAIQIFARAKRVGSRISSAAKSRWK